MTTQKVEYGTVTTILSTTLNSLANGSSVAGPSDRDNTTDLFIDAFFSVEVAGAASGTGTVSLYMAEGPATGQVATAQRVNMRHIMDIQLNGTTVVRKTAITRGMPRFWKEVLFNDSGVALAATGNLVKVVGVTYTDT